MKAMHREAPGAAAAAAAHSWIKPWRADRDYLPRALQTPTETPRMMIWSIR